MRDRSLGIADGTTDFRIAAVERASPRALLIAEDWPMSAAESLAAGADSPLLRELAGMPTTSAIDLREMAERVVDQFGFQTPDRRTAMGLTADIACAWSLQSMMTVEEALSLVAHLWMEYPEERPDRPWDDLVGIWWEDPPPVRVPATRWWQSPTWKPLDGPDLTGWRRQWRSRALDGMETFLAGRDIGIELRAATDPVSR